MGKMDSMNGTPSATGATPPKGADAADTKGENEGIFHPRLYVKSES